MRWAGGAVAAAAVLLFAAGARADDDSMRVVIAGPKKDPLAARLEKEIGMLGFTPVQADPLRDCAKASVAAAGARANAVALLCSDGHNVAVWTNAPGKGSALELRDTVAPEASGGHDDVAMRAAEVMRANVEFREAEPPPLPPPPPAKPAPAPSGDWDSFDLSEHPRKKEPPGMTERFTASFGSGLLVGTDTASTVLSGRIGVGVHRRFSLTARVDFPVSESTLVLPVTSATPQLQMQTGLAGIGVEVPFFNPTSRIIPRASLNGGAVWARATRSTTNLLEQTQSTSATDFVGATWVDAGLSIGIMGPVRLVVDATLGTAFGRLTVVDDASNAVAHFGTPFAAFVSRLEVALQ